ncbi:hypothetical protein SDJN03_25325, partial [Cucurbita argyrosperma subsp. sororia]
MFGHLRGTKSAEGSSGSQFFPFLPTEVFEGLDIKGFLYFLKIWSLLLFGQIPSSIEFALSRNTRGVMKLLYEIGVGSLVQLFKALLMKHQGDFLGETSSGS